MPSDNAHSSDNVTRDSAPRRLPCAVRGGLYERYDLFSTFDGRLICRDEADENWFLCRLSGAYHPRREMIALYYRGTTTVRHAARSVATEQGYAPYLDRSRWAHPDDIFTIQNPNRRSYVSASVHRCEAGSEYRRCYHCEEWYHVDDLFVHQGEVICADCIANRDIDEDDVTPFNDRHRVSSPIQSYNCRDYPAPLYGDWPSSQRLFAPLMGVELEVSVTGSNDVNSLARRVQRVLGRDFVMLKHDGSVLNGFEIVTAPAVLPVQLERWKPLIESDTNRRGLVSWDASCCGMHVHLNRTALSHLQIGKIVQFLHHPNNSAFVTKVAGRSATDYCRRPEKKIGDALRQDPSRYNAVNLRNPPTVEIRIFRGTLNPRRFYGNLEFCDALIAFTQPGEAGFKALTSPDAFLSFVGQRRRRWPRLAKHFVKLELLAPAKPNKMAQPVPELADTFN